jgi:hypothetical protein
MGKLTLPTADGGLEAFELPAARSFPPADPARFNRVAYVAAHVVADPLAMTEP